MKVFLCNKRADTHITITVVGKDEEDSTSVAEEMREAIQKINRRNKYSADPKSKVSYEINF